MGGGEIHKYEAQSRNLIESSDLCLHYHSGLLLLSIITALGVMPLQFSCINPFSNS